MPGDEARDSRGKISRRAFLKGMGSGLIGTAAITTGGLISKETAAAILGPEGETFKGRVTIQLNVNGKRQTVQVEPRTTLLSALRDQLELTGPKLVCDRGQCGACTVLLDDRPVLSCMTLAVDVRHRSITTVEGLSAGGELTAVQKAFVEKDGLMCGFCTPGLVMMSTALLKANPNPTLDQVRAGLSGNLCRCGTYPKVFEAVLAAAETMRKGG